VGRKEHIYLDMAGNGNKVSVIFKYGKENFPGHNVRIQGAELQGVCLGESLIGSHVMTIL